MNMKTLAREYIIIGFICLSTALNAQVFKIENGISISSLKNLDRTTNYQVSIGLDYLDRDWYELSSEVGYIRKGSKIKHHIYMDESISIPDIIKLDLDPHYVTINTTFRLKAKRERETYYAGVGPRVDFKINDPDIHVPVNEYLPKTETVLYGLKCEAGFKYSFSSIDLGINVAYLPSFNKLIDGLRDRTFTLGLSVGYFIY